MRKIQKVVVLADVHMTTEIDPSYKVVKKFISRFKPDEVVLLGDYMDVSSLSAWDRDKKRIMEGRRYAKEVARANKELDFLQKYSKKVTYLFGNHEYRVERYIDSNPEMEGLIELESLLKLEERKINYLPYNEIYSLGKCNFLHGMFTNQYHAKKTLEVIADNIVYAHTHQSQSFFRTAKDKHPIMAYALGCLCNHAPDYMKGKWSNWLTGFAVMYWDTSTGYFNLYPVNVIDNTFMFEGKLYK